jgi:hypothetical protein
VAPAARLGSIPSVDCRIWIAGRKHRREVAILRVAIEAGRCFGAIGQSLGVKTLIVSGVRLRVEKRSS